MTGDQEGNRLLEMLEHTFMTQIISQPTRENNILDLVFVTDPDLIREGSKVVKLGAYADAARGLGAHLRDIGP